MIIDVSHHNGKINWCSISKSVDSVFVKATEGVDYLDPKFLINAIGAYSVGLKVGYYHFATLNTNDVINDAKTEARWFVSNISKAPEPNLPLVLDIENNKIGIRKDKVLSYIQTFFSELKAHGYSNYMLYSYTSFLNDNLPANHALGNIKLWLADYTEPFFTPNGWVGVYLHQYTDIGKIDGINGNVDLNMYIKSPQ